MIEPDSLRLCEFYINQLNFVVVVLFHRANALLIQVRIAQRSPDMRLHVQQ